MKCFYCDKEIESKNKNGRVKKFCDRKCYLAYTTLYSKTKYCKHCGFEFNEKNFKNKSNFRKQKFCSNKCKMEHLNMQNIKTNIHIYDEIDYEYNFIY